MTLDDRQDEDALAVLERLRSYDLSARRAERLRDRCHAELRGRLESHAPAGGPNGSWFPRVIGPALGGAWCLAYLVEIIRRAAAVYGY